MLPQRTVHPASSKRTPCCDALETQARFLLSRSLQPFAVSFAGDELAIAARFPSSEQSMLVRRILAARPIQEVPHKASLQSVTVGEGTLFAN